MISSNRALEGAKVISEYCKEQSSCQNCIFRKFGAESWKCSIEAFELSEVLSNIAAKKKNHGYL